MNIAFIGAVLILLGSGALCAMQLMQFTKLANELSGKGAETDAAEADKAA